MDQLNTTFEERERNDYIKACEIMWLDLIPPRHVRQIGVDKVDGSQEKLSVDSRYDFISRDN